MPSCRIPEELVRAYENAASSEALPFNATFKNCLQSTMPMDECLKRDDAPKVKPDCQGIACNTPAPPAVPDEIVLEDYDTEHFNEVVVSKENTLVDVSSVPPSECPVLRDQGEDRHFVDWWRNHALAFAGEAGQCSSIPWTEKYIQSKSEYHNALSCAEKKRLSDPIYQDEEDFNAFSFLHIRCKGTIDDVDVDAPFRKLYDFANQLDSLIDKVGRYSALIPDDPQSMALANALQFFNKIKQDACGTRDLETCVAYHRTWNDQQRLISILSERLNVSDWGGSPASILEAATKLDNVIIDMAICDALQDAWFSEAAGYDRPTYCDSHGLRKYRQAGSGTIGHSLERSSNGAIYEFESYGSRNEFVMEKFLEK